MRVALVHVGNIDRIRKRRVGDVDHRAVQPDLQLRAFPVELRIVDPRCDTVLHRTAR